MAETLMDALATFLSEAAERGFAWGQHDCMLFAADWALALTGQDPAAAWRGTYSTETEANAILAREGGVCTIMRKNLERSGWHYVAVGEPGDIALVYRAGHLGVCAGIVSEYGRVALVTRYGLVIAPGMIVGAWRHG